MKLLSEGGQLPFPALLPSGLRAAAAFDASKDIAYGTYGTYGGHIAYLEDIEKQRKEKKKVTRSGGRDDKKTKSGDKQEKNKK